MAQEVFNLDFETMLSTLTRRRLSGTLVSDIPRGRGRKEPMHIEIIIDQGKISSCLLLQSRTRLVDNEVLATVALLGTLPWTFEATQAQVVSNAPRQGVWIPKRIADHPVTDFYQLSYLHFLVFSSIDGRKSVEEIANSLHTHLEQVKQTLLELEKLRFVSR